MKKIGFIQEALGSMLLRCRTKRTGRKPRVFTYENAKTLGIIYDASNKKTHNEVISVAEQLRNSYPNLQIKLLGFIHNPEMQNSLPQPIATTFFNAKDFSWSGKLQRGEAQDFVKTRFDLLFDLTTETSYPLQYVLLASKASYKIGRFIADEMPYDLMIDTKTQNTISFLVEQINVYLTKIKVIQ